MKLELEKKYIELATYFYYNNYFYKSLLEKKYIENFGDVELSKMKNIYETMIINKKLEDNFFLPNDNSIQFNNFIDYRAKQEFYDLAKQIKDLKRKMQVNSKEYSKLKFFLDQGLDHALETIITKASPFLNRSQKATEIWEDFKSAMEKGNFKRVFRISNSLDDLRRYKPAISDEAMNKEIKDLESRIIDMKNRFPFTKLEVLEDEKAIKNYRDQEIRDVDNMKESYEKMAGIYLSTSINPRWYS